MIMAVLAVLISGGAALAEDFPSHPITIVVPFSAGGPSTRWRESWPSE